MTDTVPASPRILLVSPNISRLMGGEGIKALRIFEGYYDRQIDVRQITHARVRAEMSAYRPELPIDYVEDNWLQILLHRVRATWALAFVTSWLLHRQARKVVREWHPSIIHFTSPISPNVPYFRLYGAPVVIGPLNGNILHPPAFLDRESRVKLIGARLLKPVQILTNFLFRGKRHATLLVSGGERTVKALELGGCRSDSMIFTLDSGVDAQLRQRKAITHSGVNWRFVFVGRLIRYKGADLAIKALGKTPHATLDIIGDGPEREALEALTRELGVADRVHFVGWLPVGESLFERLATYRALVFPTLAEANGIVVQEAMMLGLPVVGVEWGGPADLLDETSGILIRPVNEEYVVTELSLAISRLATNPGDAAHLAENARKTAEERGFDWPSLLDKWRVIYGDLISQKRGSYQ